MVMIRMQENVKRFFQDHAAQENRSLTNFIVNAVLKYIKDSYQKDLPQEKSPRGEN